MPSLWLILFLLVRSNSFSCLCHLMNYFSTPLRASIIVSVPNFYLSLLFFVRKKFLVASPTLSFKQRLFISIRYYLLYFSISFSARFERLFVDIQRVLVPASTLNLLIQHSSTCRVHRHTPASFKLKFILLIAKFISHFVLLTHTRH